MSLSLHPRDPQSIRPPELLLVDDDEVNLLLTSHALRERGFSVVDVTSGEAALARLAGWTPDLIVLDAQMPGLDGFATCRAIRALGGLEHLPVLMLTGLDDDASVQRAYQAGASDFFVKSTYWGLLDQRLRFLLRSARTQIELERSKFKLARAQELALLGSFDWYRGEQGLIVSAEGLRVFGFRPGRRVTMRSLLRLVPPDERKSLLELLHEQLRHSSPLQRDVPIDSIGQRRIIHVEAEPEFDEQGRNIGYTGIVQDVTERRNAEDHIRRLANFDALTGLPNRRQLLWRAERALDAARRQGHQVALLMIDLDNFKKINDGYGHAAGDEVLAEVARRLRGCVRHNDQYSEGTIESAGSRSHRALEAVGRDGGDEFVALLPEVATEADAERVAQRVLDAMREPIWVNERESMATAQEVFVSASVGIAMFPRDGETVTDLRRNADLAMYSVKRLDKNAHAVYGPQIAGSGRERIELETALHKAIERHELVLHYQPIVDVRSNRLVSAEALMRWRRDGKLVSPADFIPLAEESGLIVQMSEWALREAARQARIWQDGFGFGLLGHEDLGAPGEDGTPRLLPQSIAVNLPARMFRRADLVELIHNCARSQGIKARMISLEITENDLMRDLQSVIPTLHALNQIGVEIAIDDFGTGYSSLAYLTELPISELKIDIRFVRDIVRRRESEAVVTLIVALARELGHRVVGEGVEHGTQMMHLYRLGCGIMQGYYFGRPMPGHEIEGWQAAHVRSARSAESLRLPGADGTSSRQGDWASQVSGVAFGSGWPRAPGVVRY